MADVIDVTVYDDPGCPWGYSAIPALRVPEWRYGDQLRWRLVLIGLTERAQQYADRGYTPVASAQGQARFHRYGMPLSPQVKASLSATAPACRAVIAARLDRPGSGWEVHRALQFAQFTTPLVFDDRAALLAAIQAADIPGIDAERLIARLDDQDVTDAYEADRAEARTASGTPGAMQGKTANTDGLERYTAPSVVLERDGRRLEATGFQPVEAYDLLVANLDPTLDRRPAAETAADVVARFPNGTSTQEVAAIMAAGNEPVDRAAAERELLELCAKGSVRRAPIGDDARWYAAG